VGGMVRGKLGLRLAAIVGFLGGGCCFFLGGWEVEGLGGGKYMVRVSGCDYLGAGGGGTGDKLSICEVWRNL